MTESDQFSPVPEDPATEATGANTSEETAANDTNVPIPEEADTKEPDPIACESEEAATPEVASNQTTVIPTPPPATTYRWTYAEQVLHDSAVAAKRRRNGILVYSLVMTGVFLISFGLLIAVLIMGDSTGQIGGLLRPGISESDADDEAIAGVEQAKHSVVVIEISTESGSGTGTGIIMTTDGYIATNHHVVDGATQIRVTFYDGTYAYATLVGSSEMDDLAVIKVGKSGLRAATFAYSEDCYVGQTVYAIGTPAGPQFAWTTTKGIISYKDREVKMYADDGTLQKKLRLLQTDANVNPGNSGGPLINTKGEVVGVVSMKLSEGYEGIGFAIPSDGAVEILEAIMKYGNADSINSSVSHKRPMLGIVGVYMNANVHTVCWTDRSKPFPRIRSISMLMRY